VASLHLGLQLLNGTIEKLSKASILNKSALAEVVIKDARDLLANQTFTIHKLFNEQNRINERLDKIENIGVIKNG
jgi:hypothetical protein